jgi:hypothetical protein
MLNANKALFSLANFLIIILQLYQHKYRTRNFEVWS